MEARPAATCVAVVDVVFPPLHVRPPVSKMWYTSALAEIVNSLPPQAVTVNRPCATASASATGPHHFPAIASVRATITKQAPMMATTFEHLHPHHDPSCPDVPRGFAIPPAVEAIIVDGVPIVDPQLGSVVGIEREPVTA